MTVISATLAAKKRGQQFVKKSSTNLAARNQCSFLSQNVVLVDDACHWLDDLKAVVLLNCETFNSCLPATCSLLFFSVFPENTPSYPR